MPGGRERLREGGIKAGVLNLNLLLEKFLFHILASTPSLYLFLPPCLSPHLITKQTRIVRARGISFAVRVRKVGIGGIEAHDNDSVDSVPVAFPLRTEGELVG